MTEAIRTPDENFADLPGFEYEPHWYEWRDLRVHYVDVGPADAPVMLLVHGMPTWSFLYRTMIPLLVDAGYRCIAPDHLGFGRSDKPTDPHWYSIARHIEVLTGLVTALDLRNVTLVCQDWGGPIGLAQAALMPERFERLVVLNTWLHHPEHVYSDAVRAWNAGWHEGGFFDRQCPNVGILPLGESRLVGPDVVLPAVLDGGVPLLDEPLAGLYRGFAAPFAGLPDAAYNGLRRFPRSIPFDDPTSGNAVAHELHRRVLLERQMPSLFVWGGRDEIFPADQGRVWAEAMNAEFVLLDDAGHFLQLTHGPAIVEAIVRRFGVA